MPDRAERDLFERYARARRHARLPGFHLDARADVTRHLPSGDDDEALLSFARFPDAQADRRIDEELADLGRRGLAAEWKVHGFDAPEDLRARLVERGLTLHHVEALMVLQVAEAPAVAHSAPGFVVEEARGTALDELARFQEEVWSCRLPWLAGVLHEMADPATGSGLAFCARDESGRVAGSGWIDFHGGSEFAQLCGGAVRADCRGKGVYSALFGKRLAECRVRSVPFIAVDAAPMSRPILERKGLRFVCATIPMRTRPFDVTGAVTKG